MNTHRGIIMNEQYKLANLVAKMRETYGEQEIVYLVKKSKGKLFTNRQHYPRGVYVFCNSPEGGLMIGDKNA